MASEDKDLGGLAGNSLDLEQVEDQENSSLTTLVFQPPRNVTGRWELILLEDGLKNRQKMFIGFLLNSKSVRVRIKTYNFVKNPF